MSPAGPFFVPFPPKTGTSLLHPRPRPQSLNGSHWFTYELIEGAEVKRTNSDLSNTYHRSTTETIMHPIGQNILLIYPHFGIDFLQPPRFLNSEDSETVKLDYFLSFQIVNVPPTGKCISSLLGRYPYRNGYLLHLISTCRD